MELKQRHIAALRAMAQQTGVTIPQSETRYEVWWKDISNHCDDMEEVSRTIEFYKDEFGGAVLVKATTTYEVVEVFDGKSGVDNGRR